MNIPSGITIIENYEFGARDFITFIVFAFFSSLMCFIFIILCGFFCCYISQDIFRSKFSYFERVNVIICVVLYFYFLILASVTNSDIYFLFFTLFVFISNSLTCVIIYFFCYLFDLKSHYKRANVAIDELERITRNLYFDSEYTANILKCSSRLSKISDVLWSLYALSGLIDESCEYGNPVCRDVRRHLEIPHSVYAIDKVCCSFDDILDLKNLKKIANEYIPNLVIEYPYKKFLEFCCKNSGYIVSDLGEKQISVCNEWYKEKIFAFFKIYYIKLIREKLMNFYKFNNLLCAGYINKKNVLADGTIKYVRQLNKHCLNVDGSKDFDGHLICDISHDDEFCKCKKYHNDIMRKRKAKYNEVSLIMNENRHIKVFSFIFYLLYMIFIFYFVYYVFIDYDVRLYMKVNDNSSISNVSIDVSRVKDANLFVEMGSKRCRVVDSLDEIESYAGLSIKNGEIFETFLMNKGNRVDSIRLFDIEFTSFDTIVLNDIDILLVFWSNLRNKCRNILNFLLNSFVTYIIFA